MKRMLVSFLSLIFCLQSFAATGGGESLSALIDDYQYSMTVEWDQKDQVKYQELTDAFFDKLDKFSADELEKSVVEKARDPKAVEAIRAKIQLMGKNPTREQMLNLVKAESKNLYAQGSSWNGSIVPTLAIGAMVAIFVYAVIFQLTHKCVRYEETDRYTCTENTACVDPSYGLGGCTNVGLGTYSCGNETKCAEYVKR